MAFWTLYRRELGAYFYSPFAYVVIALSGLSLGIAFWAVLQRVTTLDMRQLSLLYWTVGYSMLWLVVQIPVISMRVFSEEYKLGTIEMLLTAPVRDWEVVLAKYLGVLSFFVLLWIPLFLNLLYVTFFTTGQTPIFWNETGLTFLILLLMGGFFISIGVLCSSLTRNQIVAALLSFMAIMVFFNLGSFQGFIADENLAYFVSLLSPVSHIDTFARGVFDTRPVVYYLSGTAFCLFLTQRILSARRLSA